MANQSRTSFAEYTDRFSRSAEKYLNLPALVIGFIVDILALIAIFTAEAGSTQARIFLGPIAKLTIWTTAVLVYLGILQGFWKKKVQTDGSATQLTFPMFLRDNIYAFGNLYYLIPVVILLGFLAGILIKHPGTVLGFVFCLLVGGVLIVLLHEDASEKAQSKEQAEQTESAEWGLVYEQWDHWKRRINSELGRQGYITHLEMSHIYLEKTTVCAKALALYQKQFGEEGDFALIDESLYNQTRFPYFLVILVLTQRSLSDTRPWMQNTERYFELKVR